MSTEHRESLDNERSPERLEAFSDGVMAVAITVIALFYALPAGTLAFRRRPQKADSAAD